MDTTSTIVAPGSPPGVSSRAVIRISGPDALDLADVGTARGFRAARITFDDLELPVLAAVFPGPASYTGQDTVELQLPGNPHLVTRVVAALVARGTDTRLAEPGEFTARAFLNGRMSLTQAEGVAAIVAARSDAELRASRMLTDGRLGRLASELADDLAATLALVEAGIDFTDQEDVVAISPADLEARVRDLATRIDTQLARSTGMEQLRAIPRVVLSGPPNAGKSTLFNTLLGHRRAVVSPTAGTTRDVLEEPLTLPDGSEVMLVDVAGRDDADDPLALRMRAAAEHARASADLVLECVPDDRAVVPGDAIVVRTKTDLDLDALRADIARALAGRTVSLAADTLALQPRHEAALRGARDHLAEAAELVAANADDRHLAHPELAAASLRAALDELAILAGAVTPDDVLGRVFSEFCIGK